MRNEVPYLTKWFERFAKHHSVLEVFGAIRLCKKALKPALSGDKSATPPAALMKKQTIMFNKKKMEAIKEVKEDSFGEDDLFADDDEADKEAAKKVAEVAKK